MKSEILEESMKTTYLIWKNPPCGGTSPDWQEMSKKEFNVFSRSLEAKGRFFIKLPSTHADGSDGAIVMETTEIEYCEWKRSKNRSDYLRRIERPFTTLSYNAMETDCGDNFNEESLVDDCQIEAEYIRSQEPQILKQALKMLDSSEYELINFLFLSQNGVVDQDYADKTGIARRTVAYRKKAILKKLKNFIDS